MRVFFRAFYFCMIGLLFNPWFFLNCQADIAIMGGQGQFIFQSDAPSYPLANSLSIGKKGAAAIKMPSMGTGQIIQVAIDSHRGNFLLVGQNGENNLPAIYGGSIVNFSTSPLLLPRNATEGFLLDVAFDSKGTAIMAGGAQNDSTPPIAYRLPLGAKEASSISLPGSLSGTIVALAIYPDDTAILVGQDNITSAPLIYLVPQGATEGVSVSLPDSSITGVLSCVSIGPDGDALIGGVDFSNNQALIYRLRSGSLSATPILIPNEGDGSSLSSIAFTSNGTAILVGGVDVFPLIYSVSSGSNVASLIANANSNEGSLIRIAIGPDNVAIAVGLDYTDETSLVYRIAPGASRAKSIEIPPSLAGIFIDVAIGSENIAVLVGAGNSSKAIIATLATQEFEIFPVLEQDQFLTSYFLGVAVYSSDGLYDIRRLNPYYYYQASETKNILKQAGL